MVTILFQLSVVLVVLAVFIVDEAGASYLHRKLYVEGRSASDVARAARYRTRASCYIAAAVLLWIAADVVAWPALNFAAACSILIAFFYIIRATKRVSGTRVALALLLVVLGSLALFATLVPDGFAGLEALPLPGVGAWVFALVLFAGAMRMSRPSSRDDQPPA